ncbi:MAG: hypothetical protein HY904_17290 [Deltaproteobacteria bacterium]|nr:hypothetical protein [Deltaproteobacteria bacterium]
MTTRTPRVAAAAALLAAWGLGACKLDTDTTPHGAVRKFLEQLDRGQCDRAWAMLSANRRDQFENEFRRLGARAQVPSAVELACRPRPGNPYPGLVATSVQLQGSTGENADVWVDAKDGSKWMVQVVKEGTGWRVENARPQ